MNQTNEIQTEMVKEEALSYKSDCWITFRQFNNQFQWPSHLGLRSYAHKADCLGIENAFLKIGRRRLVNPRVLFNLLQNINKQSEDKYEKKEQEK